MAYQLLIVVAGGVGSIVSGNPFNGLRSVLIFALFKLLFGLVFLLFYAWFLINWGLNRITARGYSTLAVT
jgi:hypothetical protein